MRIQLAPATQGVFALQGIVPVQRVLPALGFAQCPAFTEPPARFAVTTGLDEGAIFGIADGTLGQRMRGQQHAVRRRFVVVGEGSVPWPRRGTDGDDALGRFDPALCRGGADRGLQIIAVGRLQRIAPERMLDVGQQQFLVLLFMLQPQLQVVQRLLVEVTRGQP